MGHLLQSLSGHWAVHLESRVPRTETYEARIASSKPSRGFFILLISSAVIATLGLISNSTAVVIGAMIVAPLMDPVLSLVFGLAVSDGKLIRRSAVTISFGVIAVVGTASLISTSVVCVSFYGAEQQFYVESVALISLDDSVQRVVALLLSDASSEGSVVLN
nr:MULTISPECIES: DUF389 domain-containing protein [unclassified Synechococcus]